MTKTNLDTRQKLLELVFCLTLTKELTYKEKFFVLMFAEVSSGNGARITIHDLKKFGEHNYSASMLMNSLNRKGIMHWDREQHRFYLNESWINSRLSNTSEKHIDAFSGILLRSERDEE